MWRKRVASLLAAAAIGAVGLVGGASAQPAASPNVAQASKSCGYGTPASTPGGVKCLGPGEYCSHKPGYAAAYRRAGFRCDADGRLVER
jgi:di/tricarboxylate transporter